MNIMATLMYSTAPKYVNTEKCNGESGKGGIKLTFYILRLTKISLLVAENFKEIH